MAFDSVLSYIDSTVMVDGLKNLSREAKLSLLHMIFLYNEIDELREQREKKLATGGPGHLDEVKDLKTVIEYLKTRTVALKHTLMEIPE